MGEGISPRGCLPLGAELHTFEDAGQPVAVVLGEFKLSIGHRSIAARDAVLWITELSSGTRVLRQITLYAEGDVTITEPDGSVRNEPAVLLNIRQEGALKAAVNKYVNEPLLDLPLYQRAKKFAKGCCRCR